MTERSLLDEIENTIRNQDGIRLAQLLSRLGDGLDYSARFAAEAVRMTLDPDREEVEDFMSQLRSDYGPTGEEG